MDSNLYISLKPTSSIIALQYITVRVQANSPIENTRIADDYDLGANGAEEVRVAARSGAQVAQHVRDLL